jgi:hypothetical protein
MLKSNEVRVVRIDPDIDRWAIEWTGPDGSPRRKDNFGTGYAKDLAESMAGMVRQHPEKAEQHWTGIKR